MVKTTSKTPKEYLEELDGTYIPHGENFPPKMRKKEKEFADKIRGKNKFKVLDICCRRFPRGFGVDLHPESNADLLCDAQDLKPISDKSFDLTLCVEGIEHLFNPSQAVREWARVTKYALMITTQNAHCWRRWLNLGRFQKCTSPDHIYMWDEYTFRNFFRNNFPKAKIQIGWYDRYLKKTRHLKPAFFFRENIYAFVWLPEYNLDSIPLYIDVRSEALRLINSRPEQMFGVNNWSREYSDFQKKRSREMKGRG